MSGIREYLLRLVCAAFAVSLASSLVRQEQLQRIVRLCGGCLMALVIGWTVPEFSTLLPEFGQEDPVQSAEEKNKALLTQLIRSQCEARIDEELSRLGMAADYHLELRDDAALGAPVPWRITIQSGGTPDQNAQFSAFLTDQLGILPENQDWRPA